MSDQMPEYTFSGNPFIINYIWGDVECSEFGDPNQAGIGVVLSVVITAFASIFASLLAVCLDIKSSKEKSTEERLQPPPSARRHPKPYALRPMLDEIIISFADLQLITGVALLVSASVNIQHTPLQREDRLDFQDAHFILVLYECCLLNSSYIAGLIALRNYCSTENKNNYFRGALTSAFSCFLIVFVGISYHAFEPVSWILESSPSADNRRHVEDSLTNRRRGISVIILSYISWIGLIQVFDIRKEMSKFLSGNFKRIRGDYFQFVGRILKYLLIGFPDPHVAFFTQAGSAVVFAIFVFLQKFMEPLGTTDHAKSLRIKEWCGLQNDGDNKWDFGQTLALTLLLQPVLSVLGIYIERRAQKNRHGPNN
ncbi:hypothetical protein B0J11DRAFT_615221 [Dendryphion nanum]|uniref:Uncharacterized protein n=1 Tax=Dendryphion nanum TaxID=256645 RepID=A0A9P9IIS3_9PLEO|nr:hypothetical protein B0J11DRAFT_615221 [Dendryphion nanum]